MRGSPASRGTVNAGRGNSGESSMNRTLKQSPNAMARPSTVASDTQRVSPGFAQRAGPGAPSTRASDGIPIPSAMVQNTKAPPPIINHGNMVVRPRIRMTSLRYTLELRDFVSAALAAGGQTLLVDQQGLLSLLDRVLVDHHLFDGGRRRGDLEHHLHHGLLQDGPQTARARLVLLGLARH